MNSERPLYNSRIIKIFLEYIAEYYPDMDTHSILEYAEMTQYEVEDHAHWFTQVQVDRFHKVVAEKTGDLDIARKAGRYTASSRALGPAKQYTLGLVNLATIYLLMGRLYPTMSHGAKVSAKRLGPNKVEIVSTPQPGVDEKPYQCQNRMGTFEAVGKFLTKEFARIDHPSCFHKGDESCRYIITWKRPSWLIWKRLRDFSLLFGALVCFTLFFILPHTDWPLVLLPWIIVTLALSVLSGHLEKGEIAKALQKLGESPMEFMEETRHWYKNALLVEEIGKATSAVQDIDQLLNSVSGLLGKHPDFDRGIILLTDSTNERLSFASGYGYREKDKGSLQQLEFNLAKPGSKGIFTSAFKKREPFLLHNINELEGDFSGKNLNYARQLSAQAFACIPIVYEDEALGILAIDNIESKEPFTQSDINLLKGVTSQIAAGIWNAKAFEKLWESEEKFRSLSENAPDIIWTLRHDGSLTYVNPAWEAILGHTEEEVLGHYFIDFVVEEEKKRYVSIFKRIRDKKETVRDIELSVIHKDGSVRIFSSSSAPNVDASGKVTGTIGLFKDITEQRGLETQLERAKKMEAIGVLAGGVAHDLNNILSGLVSYPELILMQLPEESPFRDAILTIQKSGENAAAVVDDMLTLARRGVNVSEVVNLNNTISEYMDSFQYERLIELNPRVQTDSLLEPHLLNISGSPVHLTKSLMNLISNAAEAMPAGGKILIKTENRYLDRAIRGYDTVEEGDYVTLSVSDTGTGISSKDLDKIFEPFYTKKEMGRSGTGLGMSVVWGTVKDHRGYIDIQSEEGKGTTFTLYFPVTRKNLARDKQTVPIEDYMGRGETILLVDDVEEQRRIASGMLRELSYSVIAVSSGEEAVDYMGGNSADLMVLDMIMDPGIDGLETYRRILELRPLQRAIIASGFSETERVKEAQRLGAGQYLKKPYVLEKLGLAVRSELDKCPDRRSP